MKRHYKISESSHHKRSERLRQLNADPDFVAKNKASIASPQAILRQRVGIAAFLVPREKRLAIIDHLQAGMTPEEVYEEIRSKFGEVHIVVVRRIAEVINRHNGLQTHHSLQPSKPGPA